MALNIRPFVTEVVRLFNHIHYPGIQPSPTLGLCDFQSEDAGEQNRVRVGYLRWNRHISQLPPALRSAIGDLTNDIGGWLDLHGVFSQAISLQTDEIAVNESAEAKMREFEEELYPLVSPKRQLLSYIFASAFANASEAEKERVIDLALQLQPRVEASYSRFQKISSKVSDVALPLLRNPVAQLGAFLLGLYAVLKIVFVVRAAQSFLTSLFWQRVVPLFTHSAPAKVVKIANLVVGTIDWIIHHQFRLAICSWISSPLASLTRNDRIKTFVDKTFHILLLPAHLSAQLSFLPLELALKAISAVASYNTMTDSLEETEDRVRAERLAKESAKALRIWMDLSEMKPALPAPQ